MSMREQERDVYDTQYSNKPFRLGSVSVIENGYVVDKLYCYVCKSINIKTSKAGNKYCGEICWKKETK